MTSPPAPRWSLLVAILGLTMVFIDGTVVNVALPVMQRDLGGTVAQMQWIVEAYALVLASLVLVGGALGDRLGRKRMFLAGVALFALASVACGLAPNATGLIAARALQGVGGAFLVPGSLSLLSAAYPKEDRGGAIGIWSATSSVTAAVGPVLGGWVVSHASFRWLFFFNVPLAIATAVLTVVRVRESRDESAPSHVDVPGAALAIVGLGAIVFALLDAPRWGGIGSPGTLALIGSGIAVLGVFGWVEARSPTPMVDLTVFRSRTFAGTNALTLVLYAALSGVMFFLPFNLIQVQRYSPTEAGASLLPLVVLISVMSPWMGGLVIRHGARVMLVSGPLVAALGFALFALPGVGGSYATTFLPGVIVLGLGMGLTVAPLTTAVMGAVSERHAGVASGINNAVSRAAAVLAIAALGAVLTVRFDGALDAKLAELDPTARALIATHRGELAGIDLSSLGQGERDAVRAAVDEAWVAGFRLVMWVSAAMAAAGGLLAWRMVEGRGAPSKS